MKRKILAVTMLLLILTPAPTVKAVELPDALQIIDAAVFQNVSQTGDFAVIFHGKINYDSDNGTYPETPASKTIMIRMYSDNGTLIASTQPYVYSLFQTNGYGDFISGFYFSAADAPTWGEDHRLNITGSPAYYSPIPTPINYTLQPSDYFDSSGQEENREGVYLYIIQLCDEFQAIYPDVNLKSTTDVGTVLSAYGEAYLKSAIPGLENICPQLFYVQVYTPDTIDVVPYNLDLADEMATHTEGGELQRGMNRVGEFFDVSGEFVWGVLVFIGSIIAMIFTSRKGWTIWPGMAVSFLLVILIAVLIGDFMFNLMMIIALLGAIGIVWILQLRRA